MNNQQIIPLRDRVRWALKRNFASLTFTAGLNDLTTIDFVTASTHLNFMTPWKEHVPTPIQSPDDITPPPPDEAPPEPSPTTAYTREDVRPLKSLVLRLSDVLRSSLFPHIPLSWIGLQALPL